MCANNRGIYHLIFIVTVLTQRGEDVQPNAFLRPTTEASMNDVELTESFRQVTPGNTGSVAIQDCIDKETTIMTRRSNDGDLTPI